MKRHISLDEVGITSLVINSEHNKKASILAKNSNLPCVIFGETGTGKEEFAKLIRKRREFISGDIPFVSVNCANIDNDLASSLLFGHVKGAFSGAERSTEGLVSEANGGILFLDEIQALSFDTQQRMLRVLNDGSYTKLGGTKTLYSKFQVISATTKDLDEEVDKGCFLLDLRSRLLGIDIEMSPLRHRKEDIPKLINLFVERNKLELDEKEYKFLLDKCNSYYWQGNIRQIFHVLAAWVALCDGTLNVELFPEYKSMLAPRDKTRRSGGEYEEVVDVIAQAVCLNIPLNEAIGVVESYILRNAIKINSNLTDVYQGMKLSRNNFYIKRRKYGLTEDLEHSDMYS